MLSLREARLEDAAQVVPLLVSVLSGKPEGFLSIFSFADSMIGRFNDDRARPLGVVLERRDGSVAGFLGLLASRQMRLTSDWVQHMTSWVVAPDARSHGLRMLHHLAEARKGIFVNFSASAPVQAILPRFGFQAIDDAELAFSCLSLGGVWSRLRSRLAMDHDAISLASNAEQSQIIRDHLTVGCRAVGVEHDGRKIVAILLRRGSGRHAVAQLIHLAPADDDAIRSLWPALKGFSAVDMRCPRLLVDARYRPAGEAPVATKPRQMFVKGLQAAPREMTRAYGEPLQIWINLPQPHLKA